MAKKVEFFFDFGSPTTYLAYTQLPKIAAVRKAEIVWRPFLLGGVFKTINSASPVSIPAKGRWMFGDMKRWAKRYGVPFEMNPGFPVNTLLLMRGAIALQMKRPKDFARYVEAMFSAMWAKPRNMNEPAEVAAALKAAGFDPKEMLELANQQDVKDQLKANTDEAVARGVFGAPTFFVGEDMFWGQDRLQFVDEALGAAA